MISTGARRRSSGFFIQCCQTRDSPRSAGQTDYRKNGIGTSSRHIPEADGTFVSSEGRAQRFFQVHGPQNEVLASWRWLKPDRWQNLDDVLAALSRALPELAPASYAAPSAAFRIAGAKIPRSPHRESGRTATLVNINISEPKTPEDPDSALSFSMKKETGETSSGFLPVFLVARLELHSGDEYLSRGTRRTFARRRCGCSHVRTCGAEWSIMVQRDPTRVPTARR